uniref:Reverse transcriptase domain-containing protein n=1 Tax=Parastrongyloides trichosuri TaxID=131310 RepID=A0A0N4ZSN0_PARTI
MRDVHDIDSITIERRSKIPGITGIINRNFKDLVNDFKNIHVGSFEHFYKLKIYLLNNFGNLNHNELSIIGKRFAEIINFLLKKFVNVTILSIDASLFYDTIMTPYILKELKSNFIEKFEIFHLAFIKNYCLTSNTNNITIFDGLTNLKGILLSPNFSTFYEISQQDIHTYYSMLLEYCKSKQIILTISNTDTLQVDPRFIECLKLTKIYNINVEMLDVVGNRNVSIPYKSFRKYKDVYEYGYLKYYLHQINFISDLYRMKKVLSESPNIKTISIFFRNTFFEKLVSEIVISSFNEKEKVIKQACDFSFTKNLKYLKEFHFRYLHEDSIVEFLQNRELYYEVKLYVFKSLILSLPKTITTFYFDNVPYVNGQQYLNNLSTSLSNISKLYVSADEDILSIDLTTFKSLTHLTIRGLFMVNIPDNIKLVTIYPEFDRDFELITYEKRNKNNTNYDAIYNSVISKFRNTVKTVNDENIHSYILFNDLKYIKTYPNMLKILPYSYPNYEINYV